MQVVHTDVAVIGAGTAGLAAYRSAKAAGSRALVIEAGPYGTTCARVGCMPSKLLIAPAEAAHSVKRFEAFGLSLAVPVEVDRRAVMARVRAERDRFVGFVTRGVEAIPLADRLRGRARFLAPDRLAVDTGVEVAAASVVIATGSMPSWPAAWNVVGDRLITNEQLFDMNALPDSVAVFGPGVIGLELGQALARLGVRIRVFGRGGAVGPLGDPTLVDYAVRTFGDEFYLDTDAVAAVHAAEGGVRIDFRMPYGEEASERFDYLLAATGRVPNLAGLELQNTGLVLDAKGVPVFDRETLQCGHSRIFIAGDANNDVPLLHEAADEGRIAGVNAARGDLVRPERRRAALGIVFTDPQMAVVGGGHAVARAVPHVTGSVSFEDQGRARVGLRNRGLLHVYAEAGTGRFLGAEMVGPDAEHIAHLLAWARQLDLTVAQMLELPFYHPVVEEGLRTALRDAQARLDAAFAPLAA